MTRRPPTQARSSPASSGRGETAGYFRNRDGRRLFSVLHEGGEGAAVGIVMCHPFGGEKQFSHRPYVTIARHFASEGYPTLRLDAVGFGDSEGTLGDATYESQVRDTLDGVEHLVASSGVEWLVLFGARLGAAVAAGVAVRDPRVQGVVLVSPVVSGADYWDSLVGKQRMASLVRRERPPSADQLWQRLEATGFFEVDAQLMSLRFAQELKELDVAATLLGYEGRVLIVTTAPEEKASEELHEALGGDDRVTMIANHGPDFWSQRSMYAAYEPEQLSRDVSAWLSGRS